MQKIHEKLLDTVQNAKKGKLPDEVYLFELLEKNISILSQPKVSGVVETPNLDIPIIIIPDIHGRVDFFLSVFEYQLPSYIFSGTVLQALKEKKVCLVCVGDGVHGENRVKNRWKKAYEEYITGTVASSSMMHEMAESLAVMCMVMELKITFPDYFHFLKGNHENILNEEGNGNHPFRKFVIEGDMVYHFMLSEFGSEILKLYADFEHLMPLLFRAKNLLVSHAEPIRVFSEQEIEDGRCNQEIVTGLTWTRNNEAAQNAVSTMLAEWLPNSSNAVYISGHSPIKNKYLLRCEGKFVQIHNPDKWPIAIVMPSRKFNPEWDIVYTNEKNAIASFKNQGDI